MLGHVGFRLMETGCSSFQIAPWWKLFDRVIALKVENNFTKLCSRRCPAAEDGGLNEVAT
jgi:hypothetical protein